MKLHLRTTVTGVTCHIPVTEGLKAELTYSDRLRDGLPAHRRSPV